MIILTCFVYQVVRSDTEVMRVNVPPPVLSDHSMIDVAPVSYTHLTLPTNREV